MTTDRNDLERLVADSYGLSVKEWLDDWGGRIEKPKAWAEEPGGFYVGTFEDDRGNRYKLVRYKGDFPRQEDLVTSMRDYTLFDVRDYRLIVPRKAVKNYFLYQLAPFKVKGVPTWDL